MMSECPSHQRINHRPLQRLLTMVMCGRRCRPGWTRCTPTCSRRMKLTRRNARWPQRSARRNNRRCSLCTCVCVCVCVCMYTHTASEHLQVQALQETLEAARSRESELADAVSDLRNQLATAREGMEAVMRREAASLLELEALQRAMAMVGDERDVLKSELHKQQQQQRTEMDDALQELHDASEDASRAKLEAAEAAAELERVSARLAAASLQLETADAARREAEGHAEAKEQEIARLELEVGALQEQSASSSAAARDEMTVTLDTLLQTRQVGAAVAVCWCVLGCVLCRRGPETLLTPRENTPEPGSKREGAGGAAPRVSGADRRAQGAGRTRTPDRGGARGGVAQPAASGAASAAFRIGLGLALDQVRLRRRRGASGCRARV